MGIGRILAGVVDGGDVGCLSLGDMLGQRPQQFHPLVVIGLPGQGHHDGLHHPAIPPGLALAIGAEGGNGGGFHRTQSGSGLHNGGGGAGTDDVAHPGCGLADSIGLSHGDAAVVKAVEAHWAGASPAPVAVARETSEGISLMCALPFPWSDPLEPLPAPGQRTITGRRQRLGSESPGQGEAGVKFGVAHAPVVGGLQGGYGVLGYEAGGDGSA